MSQDTQQSNDLREKETGSNALPVKPLPAIKLGKYQAVTDLMASLVDEAQKIFVEESEAWRAEMRKLSTRPLDSKEAAQIVAGLTDETTTPTQKTAMLKKIMGEGYEVETDPGGFGVLVFSAIKTSSHLLDKAAQFVALVEMEDEEFLNHQERTGWFNPNGLFSVLEARAKEFFAVDMQEFRARFVACLNHAANGVIGGADPKEMMKKVLDEVTGVWAQTLALKQIGQSESYLTGSPQSTGGPQG